MNDQVNSQAGDLAAMDPAMGLRSAYGKRTFYVRLLAVFLEDAPRSLNSMQQALSAGDLASLQRLAHRMKGSAATLGLPELQASLQALESATRQAANLAVAGEHLANVALAWQGSALAIQAYIADAANPERALNG